MGYYENSFNDTESVSELSDSALIRAPKVGSIARRAAAVEEAQNRGLVNPDTGEPY